MNFGFGVGFGRGSGFDFADPAVIARLAAADPGPAAAEYRRQVANAFRKPDRDGAAPAQAVAANGPLHAQLPGGLTRWMALPWQTDTASCRSGYEPSYDRYLPTFWPARVPNHVLAFGDYQDAVNTTLSPDARRAAFRKRDTSWFRFLGADYFVAINNMVGDFGRMGVVETRPGATDLPDLPAVMLVESAVGFTTTPPADAGLVVSDTPAAGATLEAAGAAPGVINKIHRLTGETG